MASEPRPSSSAARMASTMARTSHRTLSWGGYASVHSMELRSWAIVQVDYAHEFKDCMLRVPETGAAGSVWAESPQNVRLSDTDSQTRVKPDCPQSTRSRWTYSLMDVLSTLNCSNHHTRSLAELPSTQNDSQVHAFGVHIGRSPRNFAWWTQIEIPVHYMGGARRRVDRNRRRTVQ